MATSNGFSGDPALFPGAHDEILAGRLSQTRALSDTGDSEILHDDALPDVLTDKATGLKNRIWRFTPSWGACVMGTGICNTLLYQLPWTSAHLAFQAIGACFLILAIIGFVAYAAMQIARYVLFPEILPVLIAHEVHSLFIGTAPMAFVTIVSGIGFLSDAYDIPHGVEVGAGLWWISMAMSCATAMGIPWAMMTKHHHSPDGITALWLLPIVPPITVAATGSTFSALLTESQPKYALTILIGSYVMLGMGLLLALFVLVLYLQRLAVHHLPGNEIIISTFLPLGPCGQGGYALVRLGLVASDLFPIISERFPRRPGLSDLGAIGGAMYATGLVWGLMLWGLGMWWFFIAIVSVGRALLTRSVGFNLGWWSFTFPLGSLALLTNSLASAFDSLFFKVVGTIMTAMVITLWVVVAVPTVRGFKRGTLFAAPCLISLAEARTMGLVAAAHGEGHAARTELTAPGTVV